MLHIVFLKEHSTLEHEFAEIIIQHIVREFNYIPITFPYGWIENPFPQWNFHVKCSNVSEDECVLVVRQYDSYHWIRFAKENKNVILIVYQDEFIPFKCLHIKNIDTNVYTRHTRYTFSIEDETSITYKKYTRKSDSTEFEVSEDNVSLL